MVRWLRTGPLKLSAVVTTAPVLASTPERALRFFVVVLREELAGFDPQGFAEPPQRLLVDPPNTVVPEVQDGAVGGAAAICQALDVQAL